MAHQIFVETTATGATQLTATQFAAFSDIAHQCPRTGGTAVYLARALYQRNELKGFDDDDLCTEIEERSAVSKVDHAIRASLWPNPSSGLLHIWIPNIGSGKQVQLRITDPSGKVVQENKALSLGGQLTIDASKLTSGLYFCYIGMTGSVFEPLKFVISR